MEIKVTFETNIFLGFIIVQLAFEPKLKLQPAPEMFRHHVERTNTNLRLNMRHSFRNIDFLVSYLSTSFTQLSPASFKSIF